MIELNEYDALRRAPRLPAPPCQPVPPPTLSELYAQIEWRNRELVTLLEQAQKRDMPYSTLAHTLTAIRLAKALEAQVRELRVEVAGQ